MFAVASKKTAVKAKMGSFKKKSTEPDEQKSNKMALAAKKTTLKAKTLIDAMQTLNLIPSFSTSNFGGDILPENVLIRNILDGMEASLSTLAMIIEEVNKLTFLDHPDLKPIKPLLVKLKQAIRAVQMTQDSQLKTESSLGISGEDYDADTEHVEDKQSKR